MSEYEIEFYWKEETVYWEDDRGFVFDGAWGREPISTVVPDAAQLGACARLNRQIGHFVGPRIASRPTRLVT